VVGGMNKDLAELAVRCDIPDGYADATLLHAGEVRKLKILCLCFPARWIHDQQAALHDGLLKNTDVSVELRNLKEELHVELPELSFRHLGRSRRFDRKWDERVGKILDKIENFKVEDPDDIYVRFLTISGISQLFSDNFSRSFLLISLSSGSVT
jgi:hypothetical protein